MRQLRWIQILTVILTLQVSAVAQEQCRNVILAQQIRVSAEDQNKLTDPKAMQRRQVEEELFLKSREELQRADTLQIQKGGVLTRNMARFYQKLLNWFQYRNKHGAHSFYMMKDGYAQQIRHLIKAGKEKATDEYQFIQEVIERYGRYHEQKLSLSRKTILIRERHSILKSTLKSQSSFPVELELPKGEFDGKIIFEKVSFRNAHALKKEMQRLEKNEPNSFDGVPYVWNTSFSRAKYLQGRVNEQAKMKLILETWLNELSRVNEHHSPEFEALALQIRNTLNEVQNEPTFYSLYLELNKALQAETSYYTNSDRSLNRGGSSMLNKLSPLDIYEMGLELETMSSLDRIWRFLVVKSPLPILAFVTGTGTFYTNKTLDYYVYENKTRVEIASQDTTNFKSNLEDYLKFRYNGRIENGQWILSPEGIEALKEVLKNRDAYLLKKQQKENALSNFKMKEMQNQFDYNNYRSAVLEKNAEVRTQKILKLVGLDVSEVHPVIISWLKNEKYDENLLPQELMKLRSDTKFLLVEIFITYLKVNEPKINELEIRNIIQASMLEVYSAGYHDGEN